MNDSLKKAIKTIVKVAEPDKIILFGSHARGDDKQVMTNQVAIMTFLF
jgi:predicted nucleotidyltransferase